jgi:hypothetical protein
MAMSGAAWRPALLAKRMRRPFPVVLQVRAALMLSRVVHENLTVSDRACNKRGEGPRR